MAQKFQCTQNQKINNNQTIDQPLDTDVLCGNYVAVLAQTHPGNKLLQETIEIFQEDYNASKTKQNKMRINRRIMSFMQKHYKSRFVARDRFGSWYLVEENVIRDKISGALRYGSQRKPRPKSPPKDMSNEDNNAISSTPVISLPPTDNASMEQSAMQAYQSLAGLLQQTSLNLWDHLGHLIQDQTAALEPIPLNDHIMDNVGALDVEDAQMIQDLLKDEANGRDV